MQKIMSSYLSDDAGAALAAAVTLQGGHIATAITNAANQIIAPAG